MKIEKIFIDNGTVLEKGECCLDVLFPPYDLAVGLGSDKTIQYSAERGRIYRQKYISYCGNCYKLEEKND